MDKQTVWVVTSGQYSDYSIDCIFDSEEKANEYVERVRKYKHWGDVNEPFEMVVNQTESQHIMYIVYLDRNGNITSQYTDLCEDNEDYVSVCDWNRIVYAKSSRGFDVAVKAARDKLNILQAEQNNLI